MLVFIAILLTLVPALFILWPFLFGARRDEFEHEEGSEHADLMMRWDATAAGLAGAELDHALGNLSTQDYQTVNRQLLSEAASIMAEMELTEEEEERMLSALREEVSSARARVEGA